MEGRAGGSALGEVAAGGVVGGDFGDEGVVLGVVAVVGDTATGLRVVVVEALGGGRARGLDGAVEIFAAADVGRAVGVSGGVRESGGCGDEAEELGGDVAAGAFTGVTAGRADAVFADGVAGPEHFVARGAAGAVAAFLAGVAHCDIGSDAEVVVVALFVGAMRLHGWVSG